MKNNGRFEVLLVKRHATSWIAYGILSVVLLKIHAHMVSETKHRCGSNGSTHESQENNMNLAVRDTNCSNEDSYICTLSGKSQSNQFKFDLKIRKQGDRGNVRQICKIQVVHEKFYHFFITAIENEKIQLCCPDFELISPKIHWTIQRQFWRSTVNFEVFSSLLIINKFSPEDEGNYECEVYKNPQLIGKSVFTLKIGRRPKPKYFFHHESLKAGEMGVFLCETEEDEDPDMKIVKSWTKVGGPLDSARHNVSSSGALYIRDVRPSDAGNYECKIQNIFGESIFTLTLAVKGMEKRVKIVRGGKLNLDCEIDGPIIWEKCCDANFSPVEDIAEQTNERNPRFYTKLVTNGNDAGFYCCKMGSDIIMAFRVIVNNQ